MLKMQIEPTTLRPQDSLLAMAESTSLPTVQIDSNSDFHTQDSLLTFNLHGTTTLLKLAPLSPASQHHLGTLLRYGEVAARKWAIQSSLKSPISASSNHEETFTLYNKLPAELQSEIWRFQIEEHPRKLVLKLVPDGDKIHIEHKSAVPVSLQINRQIRSDSFRIHGITELKYESRSTGFFFNPGLDMLVIDSEDVEDISPQFLEDLARESGFLEDIKCIAISVWLYDFDEIVKSFKKYTSLELLLIVISRPPSIQAGITEENTSSTNAEVVFELLDTNASISECGWLQIPRLNKESGVFERNNSKTLETCICNWLERGISRRTYALYEALLALIASADCGSKRNCRATQQTGKYLKNSCPNINILSF